jgi:hypothetical protein
MQVGFPADLSIPTVILTAPLHCSLVSMSMLKTRLNLCDRVIDWCFCARIFTLLAMLVWHYFILPALLSCSNDSLISQDSKVFTEDGKRATCK